MAPKKTSGRLAFIDWTRGLAALIMLQGHTFNSFTRNDLRPQGPYMLSQFAGGLPPAMFLFLTGITYAFLMDSQDRQGASTGKRLWAALKRARYLFLIAFLFRIQLFVTGYPTSPADQLLKVDILNCMGLAMVIFSPMALFSTLERVRLCSVLGLLVACLAPFMAMLDGPHVPWIVHAYLLPDFNYFGFFPWASFLAFGLAAGSVLRLLKPEDMQRTMMWAMGVGLAVTYLAHYLSNLPYSVYPKVDYWLDSPGLIFVKLGMTMCIMAVAYLWVNLATPNKWSFVRQLGTTSLIVYWVHIELVYGRWFGIWKDAMTVPQVVIFTVLLIGLMILVSLLQTRTNNFKSLFRAAPIPQARAASGD